MRSERKVHILAALVVAFFVYPSGGRASAACSLDDLMGRGIDCNAKKDCSGGFSLVCDLPPSCSQAGAVTCCGNCTIYLDPNLCVDGQPPPIKKDCSRGRLNEVVSCCTVRHEKIHIGQCAGDLSHSCREKEAYRDTLRCLENARLANCPDSWSREDCTKLDDAIRRIEGGVLLMGCLCSANSVQACESCRARCGSMDPQTCENYIAGCKLPFNID